MVSVEPLIGVKTARPLGNNAMRKVKVVAHRGASGTHPENTAPAFLQAVRLGVETIELDVQLTRDHQLVICHDPSVDRTSNGCGFVVDLDMAQIKELDAGSWFSPKFAGTRFLSLDEALDLIPPEVCLNVHVKADEKDRHHIIPLTVARLQQHRRLKTAFVAADESSLAVACKVEPSLEVCNLTTRPIESYVDRSLELGYRILQPGHAVTSKKLVSYAHEHGMEVNPFYADDEGEMKRLIFCGVDGILTNFPEKLQMLITQ